MDEEEAGKTGQRKKREAGKIIVEGRKRQGD